MGGQLADIQETKDLTTALSEEMSHSEERLRTRTTNVACMLA